MPKTRRHEISRTVETKTWALDGHLGYGPQLQVHVLGNDDQRGSYGDIILTMDVSGETNGNASFDIRLDYLGGDVVIDSLIKALQEAKTERNTRNA